LDARIHKIEDKHKLAAAIALADYVKDIDYDHIIPNTLDKNVAMIVAEAVKSA
jgi:malic enzyme